MSTASLVPDNSPPRIFVFTASNPEAGKNIDLSIRHPLQGNILQRNLTSDDRLKLGSVKNVYAWGVVASARNTTKWLEMNSGDWVLCQIHKQYRFIAKVLHKSKNANLARELWGESAPNSTWELIFFMDLPASIHVPVEMVAEHLHSHYMGFTQIGEARVRRIVEEFGSVDSFIGQCLRNTVNSSERMGREDVLEAIKAFDQTPPVGFGASVLFDLIFEGRPYPPKAIFALASQRSLGRLLTPGEISSGEKSACFEALRSLGFVIRRNESSAGIR